MTLNFVLGTAAELIKLHPLITRARARGWRVRVVATGQSVANLLDQARDFGLDPAEFTWLVKGSRDLATSRAALAWFARALRARRPFAWRGEFVVVHGDTLSTLAGAWLGWRTGARVAHVESGLRSRRLWNPFPEEITRRLVSRFARVHAAPDAVAAAALKHARGLVFSSEGNTLLDAVRDAAVSPSPAKRDFVLVNVHRFENLNSPIRWRAIVETLLTASEEHAVVFIAHPQTRAKLESDRETWTRLTAAGLEVHDRLPFSRFMALLNSARYLISDGGSNQEECSYLGVPCLLLRQETERREGLGETCVLSRFDPEVIRSFLRDPDAHRRPPRFDERHPSDVILDHWAGLST